MRVNKRLIDRGLTIAAAVAAPVLSILVRHHVLSTADAVDLGALNAAVIASYHGGAAVQKRRTDTPQGPTPGDVKGYVDARLASLEDRVVFK